MLRSSVAPESNCEIHLHMSAACQHFAMERESRWHVPHACDEGREPMTLIIDYAE
jgi:hypothetical protein